MMDKFTEQLKQALLHPLPGIKAHERMFTYKRPSVVEVLNTQQDYRRGSVLVHFYPKEDEIYVSLMLRSTYNGAHSAQVSFPGGKAELNESAEETALREAQEELGISPNSVTILGQLSPVFIPPSKFLVTPFVGINRVRPNFKIDPYEVAQLIETPLSLLMDDAIESEEDIHLKQYDLTIKAPCFKVYDHIVWGATAMMISELKEILKA